jgi:hypothetical protein
MKDNYTLKDLASGKAYMDINNHKKGLLSNLDSIITSSKQTDEYINIRLSIHKLNSIIFNLTIIFSISFFCFTLIFTVSFISKTLEIRNKAISYGNESIEYFKEGFSSLIKLDTKSSHDYFNKAIKTSNNALKEISPIKPLTASLSVMPGVKDYAGDASKSLEAIKNIAEIGNNITDIEEIIEKEKNNKSSDYKQKINITFTEIKNNLSKFEKNLYAIDLTVLPSEYKEKIISLKNVYPTLKEYIKGTETIINELPEIAGFYENKNYLILLENNNELRGSGGFIGSFGILTLDKSEIKDFYIKDVYLLDKPYSQAIAEGKEPYFTPPHPMDPAGTGNWALRDSSINPDFSVASKYAEDFYLREIKYAEDKSYPNKIDGVIAITPSFFEDILKITGPIFIEDYNITVSSDNILETLQLEVEQGKDKKENKNPKTILDILKQKVLDKMTSFNKEQNILLLEALTNNLNEKNILLNVKNTSISRLLNDYEWDGKTKELKNNEDYLMVVNNNFGGGKSSQKVKEEITQTIEIIDNKIIKTLKIKRIHTSDYKYLYYDPWSKREMWIIGDNNNYTKIYVPKGSKIISKEGISEDIFVGEENKKTIFGFNFSVVPKEEKEISITYELPFTINQEDLKIYIEKQAGSLPSIIKTVLINNSPYDINILGNKILDNYDIINKNKTVILNIKK